ncbi:MAG: FAD-binding oxidoreductase [Gammaproteobacteria bacterium]|jgi:glycine/D-amino acid oxidase-like deaminating enzyme|nr:FAD-binding oxidoreductase [Gammaproteobacteria bacterium]
MLTQTAFSSSKPKRRSYDVVIVGGAIMGASVAWYLSNNADFNGSVLVVEKDPTYQFTSTMTTTSCIRQQFSTELNVRISQYAAEVINNFREHMGGDKRVPDLSIQNFGYMYLADNQGFADVLRKNQQVQLAAGAHTQLLTAAEIKQQYPFYQLDDIVLGSINLVNEGYFDSTAVFDWWRRKSCEQGVEYVANQVVAINCNKAGNRVATITLDSGEVIACGQLVNATGPRADVTAKMAGIALPVEPRKRYSWVFTAEQPLDQALPLTIDPAGVHVRESGHGTYQAGGHALIDPAADYDDFTMDNTLWEEHIWPVLAKRIPQFEAIRVTSEWTGHYAYNVLDHNAILGPHTEVENFIFLNGFSGHGLQQAPAMGRGIAEWIVYGEYRSMDLSAFGYGRIVDNLPLVENAII